mmetsp:Transcript_6431/g.22938  ORF Transcript_6431/g.22938 Transcript_6431/m.22938 type:complete len:1202 (-) Transcript_6431:30-3635(-)
MAAAAKSGGGEVAMVPVVAGGDGGGASDAKAEAAGAAGAAGDGADKGQGLTLSDLASADVVARRTRAATMGDPLSHTKMRYSWAVVMKNVVPKGADAALLRDMQQAVVESLLRLNLEVLILRHTTITQDKLVIMVSSESEGDQLLKAEKRLLESERFLRYGTIARQADDDEKVSAATTAARAERGIHGMTPAEKLALTAEVVQRAMDMARRSGKYEDGREAINSSLRDLAFAAGAKQPAEWDAVIESFPVHDEQFNQRMMEKLTTREGIGSWKQLFNIHHLLDEIRDQFGARVAFYFAYVNYYTRWLYPLTAYAVLYYCVFRPLDWPAYQRGLSLLGFFTPALWAPLFIKHFKRYANSLSFHWRVWDVPERAVPNPNNPAWEWRVNEVTKEREKVYDPNNVRKKVKWATVPFALINLCILVLVATPFVQWYVYGKLAPTCECCEWFHELGEHNATAVNLPASQLRAFAHSEGITGCDAYIESAGHPGYKPPASCRYFISCFNSVGGTVGTDRWVYILIQGIILGLLLDVVQFELFVSFTTWLTKKENWDTEAEFERRLIRKQFFFMWVNMYFWFLSLAFVYVPFGDKLQNLLIQMGLSFVVPGHGWRPGVINIDEAFVTPLVVTQAINLTLETFIPYLMNRSALRQAELARNTRKRMTGLRKGAKKGVTKFLHFTDALADNLTFSITHTVGGLVRSSEASAADADAAQAAVADGAAGAGADGDGESKAAGDGGGADGGGASEGGDGGGGGGSGAGGDDGGDDVGDGGVAVTMEGAVHVEVAPAAPADAVVDPALKPAEIEAGEAPHIDVLAGLDEKQKRKALIKHSTHDMGVRCAYHEVHELVEDVRGVWATNGATHRANLDFADTTGDSNDYDANEVIVQCERAEFHPRTDYLDMMMQFGYVTMFTTAWALAPVTALVNNVLEIRTDAFKVLRNLQRPDPSEDAGIGEWRNAMHQSVLLSLPVVAGLIVISTGQLEWWMYDDRCHREWAAEAATNMSPDLACFGSWGWRLLAAVLIERAGVVVVALITRALPDVSPSLAVEQEDEAVRTARRLQDTLLPALPGGLEDDLRVVFTAFDANASGNLDGEELQDLFLILLGYSLPPHHMAMVMSFVDVDGSDTATFAEFALALQRSQDDFVLSQVLKLPSLADAARRLAADIRSGAVSTLEGAKASRGFGDDEDKERKRRRRERAMRSPIVRE